MYDVFDVAALKTAIGVRLWRKIFVEELGAVAYGRGSQELFVRGFDCDHELNRDMALVRCIVDYIDSVSLMIAMEFRSSPDINAAGGVAAIGKKLSEFGYLSGGGAFRVPVSVHL